MELIPALRLSRGRSLKVVSGQDTSDPVAVAQHWQAAGARRLHLVDQDSDTDGRAVNAACVRDIVESCSGMSVEVAAAVRDEEQAAAYFEAGAHWLVLGRRALSVPHLVNDLCLEYPGHIIVQLDIRDGRLLAEGWSKHLRHEVEAVADTFQREGVAALICDARGTAADAAPEPEVVAGYAARLPLPVIAADGVTSLAQLKRLAAPPAGSLAGVILEQALYDGRLDFARARRQIAAHD